MNRHDCTRFLRVPEGFDPAAILPATLMHYAGPATYFVHKVTVGPLYDARSRHQRRGWHPVKWEDMNRLFGRSGAWNLVRSHLIKSGVVECDEEYRLGEKAKWYRLGPDWIAKDTERRPIHDRKFARRLAAYEAEQARRREGRWPAQDFLAESLSALTIDEAAARRFTSNPRSERHRFNSMAVDAIRHGEWRLTICPYGRVHTNITNMSRTLRTALRWNGSALTEVDVANAQPLLIGAMAAGWVTGRTTEEDIHNLGKPGETAGETRGRDRGDGAHTLRLPNSRILHNPADCLIPLEARSGLPPDLSDFLVICEAGHFYEELAGEWELDSRDDAQRSRLKRLAFKLILFGPTRPTDPRWLAFRARWPTVAGFLERARAHDYGVPARACQRLESALMIGGVAGRLMAEHPDTPIWTIHDSVLVTPHAAGAVQQTIEDVFAGHGLRPTVKVKRA
jgi:hypothetical protein